MKISTGIIKKDLLNSLSNELYYKETDFVNLVKDADDIPYGERIKLIGDVLGEIALINAKMELVNNYIQIENKSSNKKTEKNDK